MTEQEKPSIFKIVKDTKEDEIKTENENQTKQERTFTFKVTKQRTPWSTEVTLLYKFRKMQL